MVTKASKLIKQLQKLMKKYGDLEIYNGLKKNCVTPSGGAVIIKDEKNKECILIKPDVGFHWLIPQK